MKFPKLLAATLLLVSSAVFAADPPAAISKLCDPYRSDASAGMVIGFQLGDDAPIFETCGMADIANGIALTKDHPVNVGSLTKQFFAQALLNFVEADEISLNQDLMRFFPEAPWAGQIKIKHLVSHMSGLREHWAYWMLAKPKADTLADVVALISSQDKLKFTPGSEFSYSNANYILIADIIQQLSGKKARDYIVEHVLRPSGMEKSDFYATFDALPETIATAYTPSDTGFSAARQPLSNIIGDGGLYASASEMLHWSRRYLDSAGAVRKTLLDNGNAVDYNRGVWLSTHAGCDQVEHGGSAPGISSYMAVVTGCEETKKNLRVIILANSNGINAAAIAEQVKTILLGDAHARQFPAYRQSIVADPGRDFKPGRYAGFFNGQILMAKFSMDAGRLKMKTDKGERLFVKAADGRFARADQPLVVAASSGENSIRMTYDTLALAYLTLMPPEQDSFDPSGRYENSEALPLRITIQSSKDGYVMKAAGRTLELKALAAGIYQSENGAYLLGFEKAEEGHIYLTLFHDSLGAEQLQRI